MQMKKVTRKSISLILSIAMVLGVFAGLPQIAAQALANHVVINEIYGGGGNSGALYKNDFIELYNPTDSGVSLEGWSVQYASAAKGNYQKTDLTGTIKAGGYFLIQEAAGSESAPSLPTPDATGSINLSGTNGKVALVDNGTLLSGASISGKASLGVFDYVGFGTAGDFEGAAAPAASNATSVARKTTGADTDNNSTDFQAGAPTPQNSSSSDTPKECGIVFTPNAAPDANGFVPSGTKVTLSGAQDGAEIHYQLNDGSEQTYQLPIAFTETTTVKAWFVKGGLAQSPDYTVTYKVDNM
jgi:predicted extracellular nuclease